MRNVRDYYPPKDYHRVATESMGEVWGEKGRGNLKHDLRLTERLLPDSTMTYRGRSDGLVVESDRKKIITKKCTCRHLRDLQGYCVYTSGVFFSFFFSPRQCVAPIDLMDKPPLHTQGGPPGALYGKSPAGYIDGK